MKLLHLTNSKKNREKKLCLYPHFGWWKIFFLLIILTVVFLNMEIKAQDSFSEPDEDLNSFDVFSVLIMVEEYGSFTSDAIYTSDGLIFLSVEELFKLLQINCIMSDNGDTLSGFIEKEIRTYSINTMTNQIRIGGKVFNPERGLMNYRGALYMESSLFGDFFGIYMTFNLRNLSISLKANFELPVVKQMKLEKIRIYLNKVRGEITADTAIGRFYHMLRFGNVDWMFQSNQVIGGASDTHLSVSLGSELLWGEAGISANYYTGNSFDQRQLKYFWRWVDNSNPIIKQVQLGKIGSQSISTIYSSVIGYAISNAPTSVRKAEGFYTINDHTEPNWIVELYINNILMDYTTADVSGLFTFKVPNVYGFTILELRFYGPMGEERSEKRTINMPYNFTPAGKLEYLVNGGILEDNKQTYFSRNTLSYGLTRRITLGGGLEYLSSIQTGKIIPFLSTSILPFNKMVVQVEYDYKVKTRGIMNYYFYKTALLAIDYTKYKEGQEAIRNNTLSDFKTTLSVPYRWHSFSGYSKIGLQNRVYKNFKYNTADFSLSGYYRYFNASISTVANWMSGSSSSIYSNLSLSYIIGKGFSLRSMVQADYSTRNISTYRMELEKKFSGKCYLSISYDQNINSGYKGADLTFRYNFSFARTFAKTRVTNNNIITSQGAQGSLCFGNKSGNVYASEYSMTGRGGITVFPYIDVNHNGKYEKGELVLKNLKIKINGGKVIYGKKDSLTRVVSLEPFINYMIEVDEKDLENVAWKIDKKRIMVLVDPNQFKRIEIPVTPQAEINGVVTSTDLSYEKGIGRILVKIFDKDGNKVAETLTETDGYFSYLGLKPGEYDVKIDSIQLVRLKYKSVPQLQNISVKALNAGDIIGGIDFVLNDNKTEELPKTKALSQSGFEKVVKLTEEAMQKAKKKFGPPPKIAHANDSLPSLRTKVPTEQDLKNDLVWGMVTAQTGTFYVQCGAYRNKNNAIKMAIQIHKKTNIAVGIVLKNGLYAVQTVGVADRPKAEEIKNKLLENEVVDEAFILIR